MLDFQQKNDILRCLRHGMTSKQTSDFTDVAQSTITRLLKTRKRIMVISDPHCGHVAGIVPPPEYGWVGKFAKQQQEAWEWFSSICKRLKPDTLFGIGDMIDGKGKRSGGSEQVSTSWRFQTDMAFNLIKETGAKKVILVYGTPYHTGEDEDFEDIIYDRLEDNGIACTISGHEWPQAHGITFDIKHKVGSSSVEHGRHTAVAKSKLWNLIWAERDQQPNSDVLIRGHVHYFKHSGDAYSLCMTMPALQGWGSKYGIRQCEGIVDFGLVWFDVYDGDSLDTLNWHWEIPKLKSHTVKVTQI